MNAKNLLNMLETHAEKIILGLAALFTVWVAWGYLLGSPNRVSFENQTLAPGALDTAILTAAQNLDSAIRSARPEPESIPDYSKQIADQQRGGVFASAVDKAPRLTATLPRLTTLGAPIKVEGLVDEEKDNIELVTPLPPTKPLAHTGRSKAYRIPITIGIDDPLTAPKPAEPEAIETPWVTVGAYFDSVAQRDAMIKADYAAFRARSYVGAVEVQRQEQRADGSYSDWVDVRSKAMPEIDLKPPAFDDATGALQNKEEIDRLFDAIKQEQKTTMQPPFMRVVAGDFWEPPLEGIEIEVAEVSDDERKKPDKPEQPRNTGSGGRTSGGGDVVGGSGGGRFAGGDVVGGSGSGGGGRLGGAGGGGSAAAEESRRKREQQQLARQDFAQARQAFGQGDLQQAINLADKVLGNADAGATLEKKAEALKKKARQTLERREALARQTQQSAPPAPAGGRFGGGDVVGGSDVVGGGSDVVGGGRFGGGDVVGGDVVGGGRFGGGAMSETPTIAGYSDAERNAPLLKHPEKEELTGIWYHDDSVEAGKTYRYRMRVALWNRYVGRTKAVKDPQDAKTPLVRGEWSLPSDPITVTPAEYFFLIGPSGTAPDVARMEIWKWRDGFWLKETFDAAIGDVIGEPKLVKTGEYDANDREVKDTVDFSTGAIVLDIRTEPVVQRLPRGGGGFNQSNTTSMIVTYLDPADGQVKERVQAFDTRDAIRTRLKDEAF